MKLRVVKSDSILQHVKVGLFKPGPTTLVPETDVIKLYISDRIRNKELVCRSVLSPHVKYIMEGEGVETLFYGMLLNSDVGVVYNQLLRNDRKLILNHILDLPFPEADEMEVAGAALMESYILAIDKFRNYRSLSEETESNLKVTSDFLNMLSNYYVSQLYLPMEFKNKGIDIIGRWEEVIKVMPDDAKEESGMMDLLLNLIKTIVRENIGLLQEFNKMKVYQIQLKRELRNALSRILAIRTLKREL